MLGRSWHVSESQAKKNVRNIISRSTGDSSPTALPVCPYEIICGSLPPVWNIISECLWWDK
ncbi:hypothetical protein Ciccas_011322 [Cichlidogyrus casuarinus]|uniref:Uncharacterized protein n=1 Tax=Cichlidogyrus casuarinus TaxID=1844966 RepID=A0ABD2PWB5_9PLAT